MLPCFPDGRYGAACATGDGDHILRFCPSSRVLGLMEHMHPREACKKVVKDIVEVWRRVEKDKPLLELGIIAMNVKVIILKACSECKGKIIILRVCYECNIKMRSLS